VPRALFRRVLSGATAGAVAAAALTVLASTAPAAAVPPDPTGPTTLGIYANTVHYNSGAPTTRGWKVSWEVPLHTNADQAWMAVGQWYFGFESGVYYTNHEGWWVYYYGDDDGHAGNNPACFESWGSGGHCTGAMENLSPGDQVTFTYQWCDANNQPAVSGPNTCVWVNMHDGAGDRFLAVEARAGQTVEMYTHEVETFGDSGAVEPIIPCDTQPVLMLGQQVRSASGAWTTLIGNQWDFRDNNPNYKFQNINTAANPATWESCSETPACPAAWDANTLYSTGTEVGHNGRKWRARWWTYGNQPGASNAWDDLGPC
jgi:hypothetical protein